MQLDDILILSEVKCECECDKGQTHEGGKARAVTLQPTVVFNEPPHCPVGRWQ